LQRDKLKQYQKKIQTVLDREQEIARQHVQAGNKVRALIALRRRKYQENLLVTTEGQLETLEQLVSTIEFSLVQQSVLHGLKQGNEVLTQIHKEMNMESVEKLLEETAEAQAYQREIDEMLANTLSLDEEEAVQAELKAMQEEAAIAARQEDPQKPLELPNVPNDEPVVEGPGRDEVPAEETRAKVALAA